MSYADQKARRARKERAVRNADLTRAYQQGEVSLEEYEELLDVPYDELQEEHWIGIDPAYEDVEIEVELEDEDDGEDDSGSGSDQAEGERDAPEGEGRPDSPAENEAPDVGSDGGDEEGEVEPA